MISTICSGGQTGADQGALRAARAAGIPTSGWVPRGWKTEAGPAPWLADWGLKEHESSEFPPRTEANARDSDATIWFGSGDSRGYWCTRKAVWRLDKLWLEVGTGSVIDVSLPSDAVEFIRAFDVKVLNVAGNRESSSPGIEERVFRFLTRVFRILREA